MAKVERNKQEVVEGNDALSREIISKIMERI